MHSVAVRESTISQVQVTNDRVLVSLTDNRILSIPLAWYPRLAEGTPSEQATWRLIGRGTGIHWPLLDEDLSLEQLFDGRPSGEQETSLTRWRAWLAERRQADAAGRPAPTYPAEIGGRE